MAYTPITNSQVDPDSPVTADLMSSLRDNPIAIANGDSGAPRIQDAALSGTVTASGRNWVANRTSGLSAGGVGTYAFARVGGSDVISMGDTVAGSSLVPSDVNSGGGTLSGTWRCMGRADGTSGVASDRITLWLRIS